MSRYIFTVLFSFYILPLLAQIDMDKMLAKEFYVNGEFGKAVVLYEKLFSRYPDADDIYRSYYNTLLALEDFRKAEKVTKKKIKRNQDDLSYVVDLGNVFSREGVPAKANTQFEKAVNGLKPDKVKISKLANAFIGIREYDYAIKSYLKGRKLFKGNENFNFQLALVYERKGDIENMVSTYLDHLEQQPGQLQFVKNALQRALTTSDHFKEFQSQVYKKIKKHSDNILYPELLIWQLIQIQDFEGAFLQVKALDRRFKENGKRVLDLARIACGAKAYDAAINAYKYVIDNSYTIYYNLTANIEMLNCKKSKILFKTAYTIDDLTNLEGDYEKLLADFGINNSTSSIIKELAELESLYLHDLDRAIELLEDVITFETLPKLFIAQCKLDLGDYYLMKGENWEATLLYSQVDKAFKDAPIAEEARFKNARLSYYRGEFEWAQAQLEILQASTSELIANDALDLYVFIQDNLGLDTIEAPMLQFAHADLLAFQNRDDAALAAFDSLNMRFPDHKLTDDVWFSQAQIWIKKREYATTIKLLNDIITSYSREVLADDALFQLAHIYEEKLGDKENAMKYYQELIISYSGSLWVVEARKRFRRLRGDEVN